jgi:O-antigen ligase
LTIRTRKAGRIARSANDPMIDHCNRWLLGFAAAYLALQPTNVATFAHSVAFAGAVVFALAVLGLARHLDPSSLPSPGWSVLAPLFAWALWSLASTAWSIDPDYSRTQLAREIGDSLVVMFVFYVAARDAHSFRVLAGTALASFGALALLAIGVDLVEGRWDAGRWHQGVGPWATWTVLVAPFLFALIAPRPAGFGTGKRSVAIGLSLLALMVATDRMTDNRIVWVALAAVFGVASVAGAMRWPQTLVRTPVRWIGPLLALLLVLGVAFSDSLRERAAVEFPRQPDVTASIERDPRLVLWEAIVDRIEVRPWLGYGFGRRVLADDLARELGNPLLAHAHNMFASQWLQTGLVGTLLFTAILVVLLYRYVRFLVSRDDTLAFIGLVGLAVVTGFVVKNLTDDFLFRSNAKEFWALCALLLGYGMRRGQEVQASTAALAADLSRREPARAGVRARAEAELADVER